MAVAAGIRYMIHVVTENFTHKTKQQQSSRPGHSRLTRSMVLFAFPPTYPTKLGLLQHAPDVNLATIVVT